MTGWTEGTNFGGFLLYVNDVFGVVDHNTVNFSGGIGTNIGFPFLSGRRRQW